jgi:hypothetical protein
MLEVLENNYNTAIMCFNNLMEKIDNAYEKAYLNTSQTAEKQR